MSKDLLEPIPDGLGPKPEPEQKPDRPPPPEYVLPKYRSRWSGKRFRKKLPGPHIHKFKDGYSILFAGWSGDILFRIDGIGSTHKCNTVLGEILELLHADAPEDDNDKFGAVKRASKRVLHVMEGAHVMIKDGELYNSKGVVVRESSVGKDGWVVKMRSGPCKGEEIVVSERSMKVLASKPKE